MSIAEPEHVRVLEEGEQVRLADHRAARPVVGGQERDHRRRGEGVDRLLPEARHEPAGPGRAQGGGELAHLGDHGGEAAGDRLPEKLRQADQRVEVGVAVDEARDDHPAAGVDLLRLRPREAREVGPHGGDAVPRHRHVPADDLGRVDVDDLAPPHEEVGRRLAERHAQEACAVGHAARPAGVTSRVQPRRARQVRSNSA